MESFIRLYVDNIYGPYFKELMSISPIELKGCLAASQKP